MIPRLLYIDRQERVIRLHLPDWYWLPTLPAIARDALKVVAIGLVAWMLVAFGAARQGDLNIQTAHNAEMCVWSLGRSVRASEAATKETLLTRAALVYWLGAHPQPRVEIMADAGGPLPRRGGR